MPPDRRMSALDLGLRARLLLIFATALMAVCLAATGIRFGESRGPTGGRFSFPRIEQAAGVLDLLRTVPPDRRPLVLRAVGGPYLDARILDQPPPDETRLRRAPRIEDLLRRYAAPGLGDGLRAYTDPTVQLRTVGTEGVPARVLWPMPDGGVLALDTLAYPAVPPTTVLGLVPGVWIGLSGLAVAGLALLVTARELRPLRRLTAAATRFDGLPPAEIAERGAPDVRRLIRAVSDMQRRLAALLQERSFLIGAISHDLRTYLTRLRLRIEGLADADQRRRAAADLDAMTDLIDTSLAFARGTSVAESRNFIDLADLVAVEAAERSAVGQSVSARPMEGSDAQVLGDPVALRRVVANLVDNAVKFGRGRVDISVERGDGSYSVVVEDDGPGVSDVQRGAIFSPFYRSDGSRNRDTGGSGLGLAIARQIVEAHRGTITVGDSRLGGARFVVSLPRGDGRSDAA